MGTLIIDSHVHIGKHHGCQADADALICSADKLGFDKIFCSHFTAVVYDMHEGNAELAKAVARYPDRILGYAAITSPRYGQEALEELERCVETYGMRGLKIYSRPRMAADPQVIVSICEPCMYPIVEKAAAYGLPILAHATPEECETLAQAVPESKIIMAHMGNTAIAHGNWHRAIVAAQRYGNIYLETCSSTIDMGHVEAAVEAIGAERVIFGTDMPFLNPHVQLARITGAEINPEAKELILGGNMVRLLGLQS